MMKKLVKPEKVNEMGSYYEMLRCSCGICNCNPICNCVGGGDSSTIQGNHISRPQTDIEGGYRNAPAY